MSIDNSTFSAKLLSFSVNFYFHTTQLAIHIGICGKNYGDDPTEEKNILTVTICNHTDMYTAAQYHWVF